MNDQAARERIARDLDTSFLVEAGAGAGKTTALVSRLVAHIRRGTPIATLAAVTFTRKAANELRERFQLGLEAGARDPATPSADRDAFEAALADLDRAFLGTIHAFCGRLLRERPLDAGLDPGFAELDERTWPGLVEDYWDRWMAEARDRRNPLLGGLDQLGLEPEALREGFREVVDNPDVDYSRPPSPPPDCRDCRSRLEQLMERAQGIMPQSEPAAGWDDLQRTLRRLWYRRRSSDWSQAAQFCQAIDGLSARACAVTQNRWGETRPTKAAAKALHVEFEVWRTGACEATLTAWREHRYGPIIDLLRRAADDFATHRARTGQLGFADLLVRAAGMLRTCPAAREVLGERYRHLLVDEFQDTDPIQAEVCFLLASPPTEGDDWRRVRPRPGALFVVGDPKQSIYRFRRADIATYNEVRARLEATGEVLQLTRNFRSTGAIGAFVNDWARPVFPDSATPHQAAFARLETIRVSSPGIGVHLLPVPGGTRDAVVTASATAVAAWIEREVTASRRQPGDFLVLTWVNRDIEPVARALAERNIPAITTGAPLPQERELRELLLLLRTLADPANPVLVAAVLEGLFFGLTPADLYAARSAGARFTVTAPAEPGHAASEALDRLHQWWRRAGATPPDVFLDHLLDETGLLAWSASQPLGESRAGALLQLVEATRQGRTDRLSDLPGMVLLLQDLLAREAPDAPLRPGRRDVVRVMNLHKAKGLEATVVVLAAPAPPREISPERSIRRERDGAARGSFRVTHGGAIVAQAPGWATDAAAEVRYLQAERERLLYVAATRARDQLIITDGPDQPRPSCWAPLAVTIRDRPVLEVPELAPAGRQVLSEPAAALLEREVETAAGLAAARRIRWTRRTVTRMASEIRDEQEFYDLAEPGHEPDARAIGRVLHAVIEAMGRGRRGENLREFTLAVARGEGLDAHTQGRIADGLERLLASPALAALLSVDQARFELSLAQVRDIDGHQLLVDGVLDAARQTGAGWEVVDWKLGGKNREARPDYRRQVEEYATMLAALTGQRADGRVVAVELR